MFKKKIAIMVLVLVCLLGLVACGSNNNTDSENIGVDKNSTSSYIGTWKYTTEKGVVITFYFEKGGVGKYTKSTDENTRWDFTYEVKDEVVVLSRNALGTEFIASYELNDDGTVLKYVTGDLPQGEFTKVSE